MVIEKIVAPYFETNCWILAPSPNSECLIVDPGIAEPNLLQPLKEVIAAKNLKPIAILLTHGHLDHTFSVVPIAKNYGTPALIHPKDRGALRNPYQVIMRGGPTEQIINALGIKKFEEPEVIREVEDGNEFEIAGFKLKVSHAPGHTAGSTMFLTDEINLISGDVLFAGSIGRTDMPSGSMADMKKSLSAKILPLPDEVIVLPGHGPQTTIARERKNNSYLQEEFLRSD